MVLGKAVDNLKDRPHDEKKAVAGGIAIGLVALLLIGWGFLFLRKIQRSPIQELNTGSLPTDQFNYRTIQDAQQQISSGYQNTDELRQARESAAQNQVQGSDSLNRSEPIDPEGILDGFGNPNF